MTGKNLLLCICACFVALTIISCSGGGQPNITVQDAMIMPSGMMKGVASSFMLIVNNGGGDVLTGCSLKEYPSARGELHDFKDDRMTRVEKIKIPAHKTTELRKGSLHIMFFDMPGELDETLTLILDFEKTGPVEVVASTVHRK